MIGVANSRFGKFHKKMFKKLFNKVVQNTSKGGGSQRCLEALANWGIELQGGGPPKGFSLTRGLRFSASFFSGDVTGAACITQ